MIVLIFFVTFNIGAGFLFLMGKKKNPNIIADKAQGFRLGPLYPIAYAILDRISITSIPLFQRLMTKLAQLYGSENIHTTTKNFIAEQVSLFLLVAEFFTLLSLSQGPDQTVFAIGLGLAVIIFIYRFQKVEKDTLNKKREIESDLPDFLSKLVLLVNAGESMQNAIINIANSSSSERPLYKELKTLAKELEYGKSFTQAIDEFAKRCLVQQVTVFATSVILNYRRGGEELTEALNALARENWENRKLIAKTLAEEASSKLLIPMMFIFVVVAVIVVTPVLLMM
ncbi:hypothetical protein DP73_03805 [Desulfosporosinus sp. HMP52]|uniref:type II secretion system F family protein n=1 Tax=Desulfosporosinus sp. HMP52 TaxID=1487923 RepID=UPI00051FBD07|nr:type II secretion system F family protein [Desulfosporosinus sp. HMP52]KGK91400.1 hypothetical protein DP73_03805 [Desulfosporosinus sp. HMP52]